MPPFWAVPIQALRETAMARTEGAAGKTAKRGAARNIPPGSALVRPRTGEGWRKPDGGSRFVSRKNPKKNLESIAQIGNNW